MTYQEYMAQQAAETRRIAALRAEFDTERSKWAAPDDGVDMTIDPEATGHRCGGGAFLVQPVRSFNPHDYLERTSDRTIADRAERGSSHRAIGGGTRADA